MSLLKSEDSKKWIHAFLALAGILLAYLTIRFLYQMGEMFDLEAKIQGYRAISQVVGGVLGLAGFLIIVKSEKASNYLNQVYSELLKVVWPDKDSVIKVTIGIVIGLSIVSGIFVLVDYLARSGLELLY